MTGRFLFPILFCAALALALDRASKVYVLHGMALQPDERIAILPFLDFVLAWNYGVNFGLFASHGGMTRLVLIAIAFLASAALFLWAARAKDRRVATGAGAIIGGALGNAWDRVEYGAVLDFLNVHCCGIRNPWSFNIADAAIFGGILLILLPRRPSDAGRRTGERG